MSTFEQTYRRELYERANRVIPAVAAVAGRGRFLRTLGIGLFLMWAILEGSYALLTGQEKMFYQMLDDTIEQNP